jgi:hypothetical protein
MNSLTAFLTAVVIAVSISTVSLRDGGNQPTSIGSAVEGTIGSGKGDLPPTFPQPPIEPPPLITDIPIRPPIHHCLPGNEKCRKPPK